MNENNLIPMNKRNPSEAREIAKKGGMKSGEARRKRKVIKQIVTEMLYTESEEPEALDIILESKDQNIFISNGYMLVKALYDKAMQGDVKAFETIMKYAGEDPDQKRKDAELKLKREALKLQTERFKVDNEIKEPVKIIWGLDSSGTIPPG